MKKGIYAILTVLTAVIMILAGCDTGSNPTSSQPYGITILPESSITFTAVAGYTTAPAAQTVTVSNRKGNAATGALTIALSGDNADSFTLSETSIPNIEAEESADFTVEPKTGLDAGEYTAKITVSGKLGKKSTSKTLNVSFTVSAGGSDYGISISPKLLAFDGVSAGYTQPAAKKITVSNPAGNAATGPLTVALSGTNKDDFTLSPTSITNIEAGQSTDISVTPKTALSAGTHTATITVSNANITTDNSAAVSFIVSGFSITLPSTPITFTSEPEGYAAPTAKSVTVSNPAGNAPTGPLTVALSGTNATSFTLSKTSLPSIAANGTDNFTIQPKAGLVKGPYTANIIVSNTNITSNNTVSVNFTVNPGAYGISLEPDKIEFDDAIVGYTQPEAQTITVKNAAGKPATGALTIELSEEKVLVGDKTEDKKDSFTLSKKSLPSIAAGGSETFTIVPVTELSAGTYTADITVSGANEISGIISVSFTVDKATPTAEDFDITGDDFDITGIEPVIYDGKPKEVIITPKPGKFEGAIITITYGISGSVAPINAETYEVTFDVEEADDWNAASGLEAGTIIINGKPISDVSITINPLKFKYSGTEHKPTVTVKDGSTVLAPTTDYTVTYSNNINVGKGPYDETTNPNPPTVTITGEGNYSGTREETFEIEATTSGANIIYYWVNEHGSLVTSGDTSVTAGTSVTITNASGSGFTVSQWRVDGVVVEGATGETFTFSTWNKGKHNVSLVVLKGGKAYSTTIVITVN